MPRDAPEEWTLNRWTRRAALIAAAGGTAAWPLRGFWGADAEAATERARDRPVADARIVRGMTVSCPTWGWEWGTDAMVETMAELKELGVNWIAIHPYARIDNDGTVAARGFDPAEPPDWITRPIAEAHALGMSILLKPHIAYWGSRFDWRGAIDFPDAGNLARFWSTYPDWIERVATIAADADAFVVGTELDKLLGNEAGWRDTIARVRKHTDAHLTYAANWDAYATVPFWDALDAVGVQAYFPVVPGTGEPDERALAAGWARILEEVSAVAAAAHKPVVFTELGYNESSKAAQEPWSYHRGGPQAAELQARCLDAALSAIDGHPAVVGAFLWKWFPGTPQVGDFRMSSEHTRAVIRSRWREGLTTAG